MGNDNKIKTKIDFSSNSFKKYFKNTSWLFAEKVFRILISFIVAIFVIRYLGPKDFGLLSYALSFYGLFSAISTLGLENIIIRELVKNPAERNSLLGSSFRLRLLGAGVTIIFIGITLLASGEASDTSILILIISASAIFQSFSVIEYYYRSEVKAKYSTYALSASVLLTSALKILLVILKAPLIYFAFAVSGEFFIAAAGYLIIYNHTGLNIFAWKFRKEVALNLLKDSWPLILSGLVVSVYMKVDQVMIKYMLSSNEVGYYASAVRLCEAWYFIPVALTNSLFPAIINAKKVSEEFYNNRMQKLYDILAWMAIAIAIPVSIFSSLIISIIFGSEYQSASPVLTIYIWAGVAVFLGVASSQYLINENLTKLSFFRTFIGMILNVILNFLLIPVYGIVGAAIATLVSYSLATFAIIFFKRTIYQGMLMLKSLLLIDLVKGIMELWRSHLVKK